MMRILCLTAIWAGLVATVFAQDPTPAAPKSLFEAFRPDAMVTVRKHPTGADEVRVTMMDPAYPTATLQNQIQELGRQLGAPPRGVQFAESNLGGARALEASFAVTGLITGTPPILRLQPIARSFLAGNPGATKNISVIFQDQTPTEKTIKSYESDAIRIESQVHPGRIGIEYRIQYLTQDANRVSVPDLAINAETKSTSSNLPGGLDQSLFGILAVSALALGALVYCLILWGRSTPRRTS